MRLVFLFVLPVSLFAGVPSSSVTISGLTASQQVQRPLTLHRFFAEGELFRFAKPSIRDIGIPAIWQNDVKSRWRDARATVAISGATNASPIRVTAINHGFQEGEVVTISDVAGNTAANQSWTVVNVSADAFDLLNSTGNGVYSGGGAANGPAPGSLKSVLISFRADVPAQPGSIVVDFVDDVNPCSSGDSEACDAAGLDGPGMLAFNGGNWSGITQVNASGNIFSASARNMIGTGNFTYWQRGPAVTVVVAEDATVNRIFDFGFTCASNCTTDYSTATWTPDSINRPLHPMFVLSFFTGWPGVKIEYILENEWSTALKDQRYDLSLETSAGTILSAPGISQYARTRWRRVAWDGAEPGGTGNERAGTKVDYSLPYLIYSRIILPYDLSLNPSGSVTSLVNAYNNNQTAGLEGLVCPKTTYCGNIVLGMGTTGGRGDIGPISGWDVAYLYTFNPSLRRAIHGNGDLVGLMPIHIREMSTAVKPFDKAGTVSALGKVISMDSRRTFTFRNVAGATVVADRMTPLAPLSNSYKWQIDQSHFPSTILVSYLTTGDWWYWSNQRDITAHAIGYANPGANRTMKLNGYPDTAQTRGAAWELREYLIGSTVAPDNTPEKNYFMQKWNNWIAFEDGVLNNTASRFYEPAVTNPFSINSETSVWGLGRGWLRGVTNGGWQPNPLGLSPGNGECSDLAGLDVSVIPTGFYCGKPFMWLFVHVILQWANQLGHPVGGLRAAIAPFVVEQTQDPTGCAFCATNYNMPTRRGDLPVPVITANMTTTQLNIPVDFIPSHWEPPFVVTIQTENIKICSLDRENLVMTACPLGSNGRGFWGNNPTNHNAGASVESREYFKSWKDLKRGYISLATDFAWISGSPDAYALYMRAAAAGYTDTVVRGFSGQAAYDRIITQMKANPLAVAGVNSDPKFGLVPRRDPVRLIEVVASDTAAVMVYLKPRADVPCTVNGQSDDTTQSRIVSFVFTGLSPSVDYSATIHCDDDPYTGGDTAVKFATAAPLIGDGQVSITVGPSATNVAIDYGTTADLGSTTSSSCTTGCTLNLTLPKGIGYYRIRRENGGDGTIRSILVR